MSPGSTCPPLRPDAPKPGPPLSSTTTETPSSARWSAAERPVKPAPTRPGAHCEAPRRHDDHLRTVRAVLERLTCARFEAFACTNLDLSSIAGLRRGGADRQHRTQTDQPLSPINLSRQTRRLTPRSPHQRGPGESAANRCPISRAVRRLRTTFNFVGCSTGIWAGLAPRSSRSIWSATRSQWSTSSAE